MMERCAKLNKTVRLSYGCVLSAMTAILGALFIWQVLSIYFAGHSAGHTGAVFTQANVTAGLKRILPAIIIWIILAVGGFAVWEIFPVKVAPFIKQDVRYTLYRMKKKMPSEVGGDLKASFESIRREEKILLVLWIVCGVFCLAGAVYSIIYLATPSNFSTGENATGEVLRLAANVLPFVGAAMLIACGITIWEGFSAKRQLATVRKILSAKLPAKERGGSVYFRLRRIFGHKYFILGARIAVGCVGLAFFVAGICNGNMARILEKAINICTECIGLG